MTVISIENMTKSYGKNIVLKNISFSVEPGEVIGIIGPNGAGKTTLFNCLLGLVQPSTGVVLVNGESPRSIAVHKIRGFLPERPAFDTRLNAREFLLFHHQLAGLPFREAKRDIEAALDTVELDPKTRNKHIRKFSRGMLQRVGLAQVLIGRPKICILDEPASGLDPTGVSMVRRIVEKWRHEGTTVLVSSHHLDEVEKTCSRVAFLRAGEIARFNMMSELTLSAVRFMIHWQAGNFAPAVEAVAARLELSIEMQSITCACFEILDRMQVPLLLEELLKAGVPVEEALFERKNLESLFVDWVNEQP